MGEHGIKSSEEGIISAKESSIRQWVARSNSLMGIACWLRIELEAIAYSI
jgi:hypothetical protein